jgi:DMSO/TMAO reductase YedYZ molybdopterin-dependent catalytic subunit
MRQAKHRVLSRRTLLQQLLSCAAVLPSPFRLFAAQELLQSSPPLLLKGGTFVGIVPFTDEGNVPLGEPLGAELDGRLFTDLSKLDFEHGVIPSSDFYIRTRASRLLDSTKPWNIEITGSIDKPMSISARDLQTSAEPIGLHLMECAGNSRSAHFGMLSAANWHGVRLQRIVENVATTTKLGTRVLISGFDRYLAQSRTSIPGASWIFTMDQLISSSAFLATQMNDQPLTPDHGAPVRLIVPGWYGCACIKWVNEISFVPEDVPATSQMQEYAGRTGQTGVPLIANEYRPAIIGFGALPVRIEKWSVNRKITFRISGIHWGGTRSTPGLEIRFDAAQQYVRVDDFQPSVPGSFGVWGHSWTPSRSGKYAIRLRLADRNIVAKRLDAGYYERSFDTESIS